MSIHLGGCQPSCLPSPIVGGCPPHVPPPLGGIGGGLLGEVLQPVLGTGPGPFPPALGGIGGALELLEPVFGSRF